MCKGREAQKNLVHFRRRKDLLEAESGGGRARGKSVKAGRGKIRSILKEQKKFLLGNKIGDPS